MNELTPVARTNVDEYRASTDAAALCKEIVKQTAVTISGRRHVTVEGWQAIAIAHGCAASSDHVERVNDEGMGGFKALGTVRRMSDGAEIARAEGFLGDDESMWAKRPVYARRAMVQTRAISRACRSAFAHVVVMIDANLSTTPAEEMGFDRETGEIIEAPVEREKVPGITKIKERLGKMMTEGNAATDAAAFSAIVKANKDDLKTIRDANHEWWTGDGADFEGFEAFIARRRDELIPQEESVAYQLLVSTLAECETPAQLQNWLTKNGDVVESLDGEESTKFTTLFDAHEAQIVANNTRTPADAG